MFSFKKMITAAALSLAAMHAGATATLSFQSTAAAGGGTDVAVLLSDVTDLYAYNFTVSYDALLLGVAGMTPGTFLGAAADQEVAEYDPGQIFYAYGSLSGPVAGVTGSGTLMRFHFDTFATGVSPLTFSDVLLVNSVGDEIASAFTNGTLAVTAAAAVPEPASALLLGIGAVALAARRRRAAAAVLAA
jgi:hypothetical protein